jgi:hypothetical protein
MPKRYRNATLKAHEARRRIVEQCQARWDVGETCEGCRHFIQAKCDCSQSYVFDWLERERAHGRVHFSPRDGV